MLKPSLLAAGGVLSALATSACCVLPLALVSVGVGGAWIGNLTALAPYQPLFLALAVACLGLGFWLAYRPARGACAVAPGGAARLGRLLGHAIVVKTALWLGAGIVALSLGAEYGGALLL